VSKQKYTILTDNQYLYASAAQLVLLQESHLATLLHIRVLALRLVLAAEHQTIQCVLRVAVARLLRLFADLTLELLRLHSVVLVCARLASRIVFVTLHMDEHMVRIVVWLRFVSRDHFGSINIIYFTEMFTVILQPSIKWYSLVINVTMNIEQIKLHE
jgi:hypothetical protein